MAVTSPRSGYGRWMSTMAGWITTLSWIVGANLHGQQIQTTVPMQNMGDSFHENFGVGGSISGPSISMGWGPNHQPSTGAASPTSGGIFGNSVLQGGTGLGGVGAGISINFGLGQGSLRSNSVQAPSITTIPGQTGAFSTGTVQPFVIGNAPVVGTGPMVGPQLPDMGATIPWQQQLSGSIPAQGPPILSPAIPPGLPPAGGGNVPAPRVGAGLPPLNAPALPNAAAGPPKINGSEVLKMSPGGGGSISADASDPLSRLRTGTQQAGVESVPGVSEIIAQRATQQKSQEAIVLENIQTAEEAERLGKPGVARVYYRAALEHASPNQKADLQARLKRLEEPSSQPVNP